MDVKLPFLHQHYLLFDEYKNQEATCDNCNRQVKDNWAYNCERCNFWLHSDCAEQQLPPQISHPLHSQHPLILRSYEYSRNDDFICKGCFTLSRGHRYICKNCNFRIEVLCASYTKDDALEKQGQRSDDRYKRIDHFIHHHPLDPCKYRKVKSIDYTCRWCDKFLSGMCYGCLPCSYYQELYFHEFCLLSFPTRILKHPFHPTHPLHMQRKVHNSKAYCNACKDEIQEVDGYNCRKCEFWLHGFCARPTYQPYLKHEFHEHRLSYFQISGSLAALKCNMCHKKICVEYDCSSAKALYRCVQCDVNLHLQCVSILPIIKHRYHKHDLKFMDSFMEDVSDEYYCDFCEEERHQAHPIYYCEKCKYIAHVQCALNKVDSETLLPKLMEQEETEEDNITESDQSQHEIEHFTHEHPLQFYEVIGKNDNLHCKACNLELTRETYGCESCKYYLHKTCAKLPHEMRHPLHPQHPLKLMTNYERFLCCQCRDHTTGFSYFCFKCDFKAIGSYSICCQCAVSTTPKNDSETERESKLCFFCKDRELFFWNNRLENDRYFKCRICCLPILGPAYMCFHCRYVFHESCVGFPWEIQLPNLQVSPLHPISVGSAYPCCACGGEIDYLRISYSYQAGENNLNFHLQCANSLKRAIKSESHDQHPLFYFGTECQKLFSNDTIQFRSKDSFFKCSKCNKLLDRKESLYRCLICDINFHLKCVPIPHSITSKCHIHPFSLKEYFVEDDSGENYCDVCEEERDPKNQIYYCEECDGLFVAHIECILNQVEGIPTAAAFSNLELYFQEILNDGRLMKTEKSMLSQEEENAAVEEPTSDASTEGRVKQQLKFSNGGINRRCSAFALLDEA